MFLCSLLKLGMLKFIVIPLNYICTLSLSLSELKVTEFYKDKIKTYQWNLFLLRILKLLQIFLHVLKLAYISKRIKVCYDKHFSI